MRGRSCGLHPQSVMGKRSSPCGRSDKWVDVEDHESGYMFIGTADIEQARRILDDYVYNADEYVFAARTIRWFGKRWVHCVWLTDHPGGSWVGAQKI